jgi:[acyl-carrier-protein] S-malonyltransferase
MWSFVFPGQGSQHIGMGRVLFENFKIAQGLFEEASDTLSLDFKKLCFEGPEEALILTENTQPALLLVSVITHRVLNKVIEIPVKAMAGHSLGEYSAMVASNSLSFTDAMKAVRLRGSAMQKAVPVGVGSMIAILGLDEAEVEKLCLWTMEKSSHSPLEPANFNSAGQVVISGCTKAVDWLTENFDPSVVEAKGKVKLTPLKVSAPFHSSMMKPAETTMKNFLYETKVKDATVPIIQNFTALEETSAAKLKENLVSQICGPVKWTQSINRMKEMGVTKSVELGPGKVLSGLIKRIDSGIQRFNIQDLNGIKDLEKECQN